MKNLSEMSTNSYIELRRAVQHGDVYVVLVPDIGPNETLHTDRQLQDLEQNIEEISSANQRLRDEL